jgi:putative addiction module component (TIGR02574 family)
MTQTAERLKSELSELPLDDRAELAMFLIESLDRLEHDDAAATWRVELDRRFAEIDSGVEVEEPAEQVIAALRRKHS